MKNISELPNLPETFWAWLAGFIDGDGCIGIYPDGDGYTRPVVMVAQKDRLVLDYIASTLGTGCVHTAGKTRSGNTMHQLCFGSLYSRTLANKLLPYLWIKKDNAKLIINHQKKVGIYRVNSSFKHPLFNEVIERYKGGESIFSLHKSLNIREGTILNWVRCLGISRNLKEAQRLRRIREKVDK